VAEPDSTVTYRAWLEQPTKAQDDLPMSAEAAMTLVLNNPQQTCWFCGSHGWAWVRVLQRPRDMGRWALPDFAVTCQPCEDAIAYGHRQALLEHLEHGYPGDADEILDMFESEASTSPINRHRKTDQPR
jgi:hypothetical protein